MRFKKKSPRGKIAATPEDPKVPPKFVKKSNSFIIKDKDEEDGPKPVQRSSSQIFGSLRKKSIAQRRERVNQSNKQKLPPSEDAEGGIIFSPPDDFLAFLLQAPNCDVGTPTSS